MAWKKSSSALVELFDAMVPGAPAERRQMFGYPAAFVNGNLFMSLFEEQLVLRLDDGPREALLAGGAATFEPMKGRPMREYVVAPAQLVADRAALGKWVQQAFGYGQSLPPKKSAAKKSGAKKTPKAAAKKTAAKSATKKTSAKSAMKKTAK